MTEPNSPPRSEPEGSNGEPGVVYLEDSGSERGSDINILSDGDRGEDGESSPSSRHASPESSREEVQIEMPLIWDDNMSGSGDVYTVDPWDDTDLAHSLPQPAALKLETPDFVDSENDPEDPHEYQDAFKGKNIESRDQEPSEPGLEGHPSLRDAVHPSPSETPSAFEICTTPLPTIVHELLHGYSMRSFAKIAQASTKLTSRYGLPDTEIDALTRTISRLSLTGQLFTRLDSAANKEANDGDEDEEEDDDEDNADPNFPVLLTVDEAQELLRLLLGSPNELWDVRPSERCDDPMPNSLRWVDALSQMLTGSKVSAG